MDQTTLIILALIVAVIAAAVIIWFARSQARTKQLREKYGDEYDRTLEAGEGRRDAEADLIERERRVEKLHIRPLSQSEHSRYVERWQVTKADFVDSPQAALAKADDLVTDVMNARGYPVGEFESRHKDLTVNHADVAKRYLDGHDVRERARSDSADTEEMRAGMKHYEAMFDRLVADVEHDTRTTEATA